MSEPTKLEPMFNWWKNWIRGQGVGGRKDEHRTSNVQHRMTNKKTNGKSEDGDRRTEGDKDLMGAFFDEAAFYQKDFTEVCRKILGERWFEEVEQFRKKLVFSHRHTRTDTGPMLFSPCVSVCVCG